MNHRPQSEAAARLTHRIRNIDLDKVPPSVRSEFPSAFQRGEKKGNEKSMKDGRPKKGDRIRRREVKEGNEWKARGVE